MRRDHVLFCVRVHSCGSCSRHASAAVLAVVVLSTALAGVLKYAVAPRSSSLRLTQGPRWAMLARCTANMFYAVADCVTRVDAWNYTYLGEINSTETSSGHGPAAPAAVSGCRLSTKPETEVMRWGCVWETFSYASQFCPRAVFQHHGACDVVCTIVSQRAVVFKVSVCSSSGWRSSCPILSSWLLSFLASLELPFHLLQMVILVDFSFDWQEDFQQR